MKWSKQDKPVRRVAVTLDGEPVEPLPFEADDVAGYVADWVELPAGTPHRAELRRRYGVVTITPVGE